jgi:restriction endonuclease S subunit
MRRYLEGDKPVANPAGFPMVKLSDISDLYSGKANRDADSGVIPFFASSGSVGKRDKHNFEGKYIITARTQSIGSVSYYDGKLWASDNTILLKVKDESVLTSRFLYYWLMLNKSAIHNIANTGLIPLIRKSDLAEIKMPLPPLPIQDEIVATLDRIYNPGTTDLADTLKLTSQAMDLVLANPRGATLEPIVEAQRLIRKSAQMVADVKAQMVAIMKSVGNRGFGMKKLLDVCEFVGGKGNYTKDGDRYPYYDSNGITGTRKDFLYDGEYIITARKMSIGAVHYVSGKFWPSDNTIVMRVKPDSNILISRFLYYWLLMNNDILKAMTSGIKPGIRKSDVIEIMMPIPPIEFQQSVLKRMADLDSQQQSLIALQKQSEDNARFILDSYLSTKSDAVANSVADDISEDTISHE